MPDERKRLQQFLLTRYLWNTSAYVYEQADGVFVSIAGLASFGQCVGVYHIMVKQ